MNKSILYIITFFISTTSVCAQRNNQLEVNTENLSKKWEVVDLINPDRTKEELKEMLSLLEGTYILLNKDYTYEFNFVIELEGTWKLKDNVIHTKDSRGKTKWVIHSLEKKTLVLSRNEAKQKIIFKPVRK